MKQDISPDPIRLMPSSSEREKKSDRGVGLLFLPRQKIVSMESIVNQEEQPKKIDCGAYVGHALGFMRLGFFSELLH
jgi:hypothetical protein